MFDIAALISAKRAVPGIDVVPAQGAEPADFQAFASILTSQAAGSPSLSATDPAFNAAGLPVAAPLPEGGKILPDAIAAVPVPAIPVSLALGTQAQAAALPEAIAVTPPRIMPEDEAASEPPAEMPKAEALTRLLAQGRALKATLAEIKAAVTPGSAKKPAEGEAATADAAEGTPEAAAPAAAATLDANLQAIPVEAMLAPAPIVLPAVQFAVQPPATGSEDTGDQNAPSSSSAAPALPAPAAPPMATSAIALAAAGKQLFQQQPTAAAVSTDSAVPAPLPVIEAAANADEAAAAPVTLLAPQPAAAVHAGATRFRVETPVKPSAPQATSARPATPEPTAEAAQVVPSRAAAPAAAAEPERLVAAPAVQAAPFAVEAPAQTAAPANGPVQSAAAPAASGGHDFVKLVDKLIEARDAASAQTVPSVVSAAVRHAEFGQVSLHFQQDAGGLSVSMASADPDFQPAVQAAMPADRGSMGSDQGQGQQQNQAQYQSSGSGLSPQGQDQRGTGSNEQARGAQNRDGRPSANPSQTTREEAAKPDRRSGIFA